MSLEIPYEIFDVFTTTKYLGNPLAIVNLQQDIGPEKKLQIAKEFNLSETVFLHHYSATQQETKIDIYTTEAELPFAGHPTIGSAVKVLTDQGIEQTTLKAKAGPLKISKSGDGNVYAEIPHNVRHHNSDGDLVLLSIVKGMTFVLVELESLEELAKQKRQVPVAFSKLDEGWQEGLIGTYYFYRDAQDPDSIRTRMFATFDGAAIEDAATGSAACSLAAHLSNVSGKMLQKFKITQGVEMGRQSDIFVEVAREADSIKTITLGGSAVRVMTGVLSL